MKTRTFSILLWIGLVLSVVDNTVAQSEMSEVALQSLQDCDSLVLSDPENLVHYDCYYDWASLTQEWEKAAEHLRKLLEEKPGDPRVQWALAANLESQNDLQEMKRLYMEAVQGFIAEGSETGEAASRAGLARYFERVDQLDEADRELEVAVAAAHRGDAANVLVSILAQRGWVAYRRYNLSGALSLLSEAEHRMRTNPTFKGERTRQSLRVEATVFNALGAVYWATNQPGKAMDAYAREKALFEQVGDEFNATVSSYNRALVSANYRRTLGLERPEVIRQTEEALGAALRAGNRVIEANCRLLLGNLMASEREAKGDGDFQPAIDQVEESLELSRELQVGETYGRALQTLSKLYHNQTGDVNRSLELLDEALAFAQMRQNLTEIAEAHFLQFVFQRMAQEDAVPDSYVTNTLDAMERVRDLQSDSLNRARVFSLFSERYRDIFLALINYEDREPTLEELELAVRVIERMRARELLDRIDQAAATMSLVGARDLSDSMSNRRIEILEQISATQSELQELDLQESERQQLIKKIQGLEYDLREAEEVLYQKHPKYRQLRQPAFASLSDVQDALTENEAILSFQLLRNTGVLLRITVSSVDSFVVPNRYAIGKPLQFLAGMIERRDGSEESGAATLYGLLFREAVEEGLPEKVDHLIIVPDGGLQQLPFSALRSSLGGSALVQNYRMSLAPSLTTWYRWRNAIEVPPRARESRLLVLADPYLAIDESEVSPGDSVERGWELARNLGLGPLPYARQEGRSILNRLKGNGRLVVGSKASEHLVKTSDLSQYTVLHFATHGVIDDDNPERTALLLSTGSKKRSKEDGLLQIREIVSLGLKGQLVVLSSCQSASGEILSGEGVLGLARGFFVAGAHSVVGSLWPLRDDDAAAFFERFYDHLGKGASVATALAEAQRERKAQGAPAAAWAGIVAMGNGGLVPFPGGVKEQSRAPLYAVLAVTLVIVTFLVVYLWRR